MAAKFIYCAIVYSPLFRVGLEELFVPLFVRIERIHELCPERTPKVASLLFVRYLFVLYADVVAEFFYGLRIFCNRFFVRACKDFLFRLYAFSRCFNRRRGFIALAYEVKDIVAFLFLREFFCLQIFSRRLCAFRRYFRRAYYPCAIYTLVLRDYVKSLCVRKRIDLSRVSFAALILNFNGVFFFPH